MNSKKLCEGLWHIRVMDPELRVFRTVSFTNQGLLHSTYLMDTGAGFLLIGCVPYRHHEIWIKAVEEVTPLINVKWAVLFGTEDDNHTAIVLADRIPGITIISNKSTLFMLDGKVSSIEIRTNRNLKLGGTTLSFFILADKVESPALYVVDKERRILFTADAFGSLCAPETTLVSDFTQITDWIEGVQRYYSDCYGDKRAQSFIAATELIQELKIQLICPSVGPVIDNHIDVLLQKYKQAKSETKQPNVVIIHAGGILPVLAEKITAGLIEAGIDSVITCDLTAEPREKVLEIIQNYDAVLFGITTQRGNASKSVWDIVTSLLKEDCMGKKVSVFYSITGSDNSAVDDLRQRFKQLGFDLSLQDYAFIGLPTEKVIKNAIEYGFGVGCSVLCIPNTRKPKLVKCLVCGEIFDASLGACPVCGASLDQCVPVDEDTTLFRNDSDRHYVLIGGGPAAISAAEAIRKRDHNGEILVISAENHLPINRPMLTKNLDLVENTPESLFIHGAEWYEERGIQLKLGSIVSFVQPEDKTVRTANHEIIHYDKLIFATGAESFLPSFDGNDKPGLLTIRYLEDSQKLMKTAKTAKRCVVIGGGVLGLEVASELFKAGVKVTVLEASSNIVGKQADAKSASKLREKITEWGVECCEGVCIAAVEGEERITGVRLKDGRFFSADFVVVSCGSSSKFQLAKDAGIAVDHAILVNGQMETNIPGIYACGDCARCGDVNYQLWAEATAQGAVAGANATGDVIMYQDQMLSLNFTGFGTSLFTLGDPGKLPERNYQRVEISDTVRGRHFIYWFWGGALEGVVAIGADDKMGEMIKAVTTHARYEEIF